MIDGAKISQWEPSVLYPTQVRLDYILPEDMDKARLGEEPRF